MTARNNRMNSAQIKALIPPRPTHCWKCQSKLLSKTDGLPCQHCGSNPAGPILPEPRPAEHPWLR